MKNILLLLKLQWKISQLTGSFPKICAVAVKRISSPQIATHFEDNFSKVSHKTLITNGHDGQMRRKFTIDNALRIDRSSIVFVSFGIDIWTFAMKFIINYKNIAKIMRNWY